MIRQHTNPAFLHSGLTDQIVGAFYDTYNELGFGFLESNYKRGLELLLKRLGLMVEREVAIEVLFQGVCVGAYRMDMVVNDYVIVEVKSTKAVGIAEERQLLNYLRATRYEVGLLLHFGPKPALKRLVLTNDLKPHS